MSSRKVTVHQRLGARCVVAPIHQYPSGGGVAFAACAVTARPTAALIGLIGIKIISVLVGTEVTFVGEINCALMWLIDASAEAWLVSIPTQSL